MRRARKRFGPFTVFAVLLLTAACGRGPIKGGSEIVVGVPEGVDLEKRSMALAEVRSLRQQGQRVWCVPFARNTSGIRIRGNAHLWWSKARGAYARGAAPKPGAVMVFSRSRHLSRGHIAVVSRIVSDREIRIDHANWDRNRVSLGMSVIDVSERGDWSAVRVESTPGAYGKTYPVSGFVYPDRVDA